MRSIRPLSSSVAAPWVMKSTFLPSLLARSRTMRGKRENTKSIGIMRIDITASCSSRVLRPSWLTDDSRRSCRIGSSTVLRCSSMALVITSSPIRLISWSTFSTETRIDDDSDWASFLAAFFSALSSARCSTTLSAWLEAWAGRLAAGSGAAATMPAAARICSIGWKKP